MKKICFFLTLPNAMGYTSLRGLPLNEKGLKKFFEPYYDVSLNYDDRGTADYLIIPDPFVPFVNDTSAVEIKVPSKLFITKDFEKIKEIIDSHVNGK
ncbi:hypothetical protein ACWN8V_03395 [Vagococcus elongatus]|uniref:Uncharacterized protein n=1 Tax=Vagococcus elongatus TaxID=180344 RepID=A0A430AZP3_9ENTE|nr:hypothetical protein [Vagococcus elongatus]RSU13471.1 hypothetical protein CBF29_04255 [Vagococcus elongatus]